MLDLRFKFGEIVIALGVEQRQGNFSIEPGYLDFQTEEEPDVILTHHHAVLPSLEGLPVVFDSGGVWRLYLDGEHFAIALSSPSFGERPYQVAFFTPDFLSGEVYTSSEYFTEDIPFPLRYPLAELLIINLLGQERGLLLHACGVKDGESGLLFSGVSGAGKSTTANLWGEQPRVSLLSDDRVILRKKGEGFWIYGTPWHGDAHAAAADSARLEKIFVLRHATANQVQPLRPVDLAARLYVRCFPPFWNAEGVAYSLQLLEELCSTVPGFELGFLPDRSSVEFVRCMNSS